jgi:hypothetical protein
MNRLRLTVAAILSAVAAVPLQVAAWNAPTHMVTGAIAYRILENESPRTVWVIKTLLEKHPWYADRWRDDVEKLPESQRGEMLFMAGDTMGRRRSNASETTARVVWHFINWPFKRDGEPETIKPLPPQSYNFLSAIGRERAQFPCGRAGIRGRSGPPGNQNAFRHGLAGIAQRRTDGVLNLQERPDHAFDLLPSVFDFLYTCR